MTDLEPVLKEKKVKPNRSYKSVFHNLKQVQHIEHVDEKSIHSSFGEALHRYVSSEFTFAVWNIYKGLGEKLFYQEYKALSEKADIILIQEALLTAGVQSVACLDAFETRHAASYKRKDGYKDGVMTLSRFRSEKEARHFFCKKPEPFFGTTKLSLVTWYSLDNSEHSLMVINIHATLFRSLKGLQAEMEYLMKNIPDHDGPVILAGDFNTLTKKYLDTISTYVARFGLQLVTPCLDQRIQRAKLDHIFVRGLKIGHSYVDTQFKSSDHFPLICKASLIDV